MNWLGLFVKHPRPGRVKTRLAADLGPEPAADLYAAFTADLVERFRAVADRRTLVFAPDEADAREHFARLAGDDYRLDPQRGEGLGDRLTNAVEGAFAAGADRVVVIGSDSPHLPRPHVETAFLRLAERDVVLGPAADGGYYLVGLRRPLPGLFDRIDWSGPRVLGQTAERIEAAGASLALLPPWYDVDTLDDLHALRGHLAAIRVSGGDADVPHVERRLDELDRILRDHPPGASA